MNKPPDLTVDRGSRWQAAVLLFVTLFAYLPVITADFVWNDDDLDEILALIDEEGLDAVWFSTVTFNYWPVTWTSYWVEHEIFGDDPKTRRPRPTSYHIVNVLLHAISSLLLWRVLVRLGVPGAWLAGLVFALHPVNVESVAWVTQRKNVLAMVFYLAALRSWLDFQRHGGRRRHVAAVGLFLLGMLSKGAVVACPLVLLLLAWWQHGRITRTDLLRTAPFLAVAVVMSVAEIWFQQVQAIGAETIRTAGLLERVLAIGPACWFYLSKALLPLNLTFVYPQWVFDTGSLRQWLPLVALGALVATLWFVRGSLTRGPLTALLYYLLCLGPVVGLVDIYFFKYSLVADHYQYVALPGIIAVLVAAGTLLAGRFLGEGAGPRAIAAGLVIVLAGLTWQQAGRYQNSSQLWQDTLEKNPACWLAHNQLGNLIKSPDRIDEARDHYSRALDLIERQFGRDHLEWARVHNNLGVALAAASVSLQDDELMRQAFEHFETARRTRPDHVEFLVSLAGVRKQNDQVETAIEELRVFLDRNPSSAEAWRTLGELFEYQGRVEEAREALGQAARNDRRRQRP